MTFILNIIFLHHSSIYQSYMHLFHNIRTLLHHEFDLSDSEQAYCYINHMTNRLWKNSHNNLMKSYDNRDMTIEEVMNTLPYCMLKDQFR